MALKIQERIQTAVKNCEAAFYDLDVVQALHIVERSPEKQDAYEQEMERIWAEIGVEQVKARRLRILDRILHPIKSSK